MGTFTPCLGPENNGLVTAATLGAGISVCRTWVTSSREFVIPDVDARSYFCWEHSEDVYETLDVLLVLD